MFAFHSTIRAHKSNISGINGNCHIVPMLFHLGMTTDMGQKQHFRFYSTLGNIRQNGALVLKFCPVVYVSSVYSLHICLAVHGGPVSTVGSASVLRLKGCGSEPGIGLNIYSIFVAPCRRNWFVGASIM